MKIAIRGGHNYGVTGARGIIDELTEDRRYYKSVVNYLEQAGHQVLDVTPDRTDTSSQDLAYGVSRANAWGAELFISCHLNSGGGHGCEVLYYNGSTKGKDFATKVANGIAALGFTNRGAKVDTRGLYELRITHMPAILIEPLFVDTESDVNLYNQLGFDRLGKAIAEAVNGKAIVAAPEYPGHSFKTGMKGDEFIGVIQTRLKEFGLYSGSIDNSFGPKTLAAVEAFQRAHELVVDGKVGPKTWTALFN